MKYVEWIEPVGLNQQYTLICRMTLPDVAAWRRESESRYTSDEQAIDDFMVIYWASYVEDGKPSGN